MARIRQNYLDVNKCAELEDIGKAKTKLARKFWDKLEVGQSIVFEAKLERKERMGEEKETLRGKILNKNSHYMALEINKTRYAVTFADIVSGIIKIRYRIERGGVKFQRLYSE